MLVVEIPRIVKKLGAGGAAPVSYTHLDVYKRQGHVRLSIFISFRCLNSGTPSGTRTLDTLIKSQVLYQLS